MIYVQVAVCGACGLVGFVVGVSLGHQLIYQVAKRRMFRDLNL